MKGYRLCIAAVLLALPLGGALLGAGAAQANARPQAKHHRSHRHHRKTYQLTFQAEVVRSSAKGVLLRTKSGKLLSFSARQFRAGGVGANRSARKVHAATDLTVASGSVVVNLLGLQPGMVVQVTETIGSDGSITITITLLPPSVTEQASGVITDLGDDTFTLVTSDGTELRLHMAPDQLSQLGLQVCETADVTYHEDTGVLIAESVTATGTSTDGDCAPTTDTTGVITLLSSDSVTIDTGQGEQTYSVDPSSGLTDGFQPGDLVDVTSVTASDGSLQATNISFVEEQESGTVTSVTTSTDGGSLTLQDDTSGSALTVEADPNNGVQINAYAFNGISVGDHVSLTYHQAAGQLIADTVSEQ